MLRVVAAATVSVVVIALGAWAVAADSPSDPLAPWRGAVNCAPVSPDKNRHTIHSYFNISPESPDGRWVLFYSSTTPEGYQGELRILERATGREKALARKVTVEDAHRAACQQWISRGRQVVYHDLRAGEWVVVAVDIESLQEKVLARGRQLAWGQASGDLVPIYGPHWAPGAHRDLELLNVETGQIRTVVTATGVKAAYSRWIAEEFQDKPISIFFPILSPDLKRVIFKIATPAGGDFRSAKASVRELLIGYDLEKPGFLFIHKEWGHPAWRPDSRTLISMPNILIDTNSGEVRKIPDLPEFPGSHPSISPRGDLFASDTRLGSFGGVKGEWGVVVADLRGQHYRIVHRFDNTRGAASWRVSHPHPVFSPDGKRVYYNVNNSKWTQLYVAEPEVSGRIRASQTESRR